MQLCTAHWHIKTHTYKENVYFSTSVISNFNTNFCHVPPKFASFTAHSSAHLYFEARFTFQQLNSGTCQGEMSCKLLARYMSSLELKSILEQHINLAITIHEQLKHGIYLYTRLRTPLHVTCTHNHNNALFV